MSSQIVKYKVSGDYNAIVYTDGRIVNNFKYKFSYNATSTDFTFVEPIDITKPIHFTVGNGYYYADGTEFGLMVRTIKNTSITITSTNLNPNYYSYFSVTQFD